MRLNAHYLAIRTDFIPLSVHMFSRQTSYSTVTVQLLIQATERALYVYLYV